MPRTKKIKLADESQELLWIESTVQLCNFSGTWNDRKNLLNLLDQVNVHIKKGGSLRDWDRFFSSLVKIINQSNYDSKLCADIIYNYCRNTLKGRLPHSESNNQELKFLVAVSRNWRNASVLAKYARYVVRGKLDAKVEDEIDISTCGKYVFWLKENNLEFEPLLMKSASVACQFYYLNFWLPDNVHNFMIASKLGGDHSAIAYFKEKAKNDAILKTMLSNVDQTQTIADFLKKTMS